MITLTYNKEDYEYLDCFVHDIREWFHEQTHVHLILEPGDGTHYELTLIANYDGRAIWCQKRDSGGYCGVVGAEPMHIDYFYEKMGEGINVHTCYMMCDLHNQIFGRSAYPHYYDWQRGVIL